MVERAESVIVDLILEAFPLGGTRISTPRLPAPPEWPRVVQAAIQHGLAPLLYASLKHTKRLGEVPVGDADWLRLEHLHAGVGNMLAYRELVHLLDSLGSREIPAIVLKGGAIALQLYPDPGLRPLKDIDLLIPEPEVAAVRALLTEHGYSPLPEMTKGFEERFSGQQAYTRTGPNPEQVDLHWHLFVIAYYRQQIPIDWFWQHTTSIQIDGRIARALAPEAQFIHLAAHYGLHHHAERLIWLYDLALLVAAHREDMDWNEVLAAVRTFKLSEPVEWTISQVQRWWGAPLPASVVRELQGLSPDPHERALFSLASGGEAQARVILDGLDMPNPRARLRYWLRHMFPNASYMRTRYRISNPLWIPFYYLRRIAAGGYKSARAFIRSSRSGARSH